MIDTGVDTALFSGDHLAYSARKNSLTGFRQYCTGNPDVQSDFIRFLASPHVKFQWLLPGHGRMTYFESDEERQRSIEMAADAFDNEGKGVESMGSFTVGYQ